MAKCSLDPEHCINAVVLGIGSFLKDGVTMACLAGLLIILLRVRNRQRRERDEAYAKQLL